MSYFEARFYTEISLLGAANHEVFLDSVTRSNYRKTVNRLWPVLDYCDYLAHDIAIPTGEDVIQRSHEATILHLLCVGIDTWANADGLSFHDWLKTSKQKYGSDSRDQLLGSIVESVRNASNEQATDELIRGLDNLMEAHRISFGLSQRFRKFFQDIPEPAAELLAGKYIIGRKQSSANVEQIWQSTGRLDKLTLIADYLWEWRRNKFTHESHAHSAIASDMYRLFDNIENLYREVDWIVGCDLPEHILIRSALMASIRQTIQGDVTPQSFQNHLEYLIRRYGGNSAHDYLVKIRPLT